MGVQIAVQSAWTAEPTTELVYRFDQSRLVIGRASTSDIWLPHAAVGRLHCTIQVEGVGYVVIDEGSTNGTYINGQRIPPKRPKKLASGDTLEVGGFRLKLQVGIPTPRATSYVETGEMARSLYRALTTDSGIPASRLTVIEGQQEGHRWDLPSPPSQVTLGRDPSCEITIEDSDVSRKHIEFSCDLRGCHVRDLASKNGVQVNGRTVVERWLESGDEIRVGETTLRFRDPIGDAMRAVETGVDSTQEPPAEIRATGLETASGSDDAEEATQDEGSLITTGPTRSSRPSPALNRPSAGPGVSADGIIFILAGILLALSLIAFAFLLNS